jgi:predicted transcriptional regulator
MAMWWRDRPMKKTTVNIPKQVHKDLKVLAVKQDRELSEVVTEALEQYLASRTNGEQ